MIGPDPSSPPGAASAPFPDEAARAKYAALLERLRPLGRAAVAFSGGVDSSLLLCAAREALGEGVLAVTAVSPLYHSLERRSAGEVAARLGARHIFVDNAVLERSPARFNPRDRCYHCKLWGLRAIGEAARAAGIAVLLEGSNVDDLQDDRPGFRAIQELGVRSPLCEVGMGKTEIRALARERGLPNWGQPALACLGSRFPYGEEITPQRLSRIEKGEEALRALGIEQVRVRDHGSIARLEVPAEAFGRLTAPGVRERLAERFRELGFTYTALDLTGYRLGAMNEGARGGSAAEAAP